MDIWADLHTHTIHSHGSGTVEDNVRAAREMGLEAIAITDHGPASFGHLGMTSLAELEVIRGEVRRCSEIFPGMKILTGIEANIISSAGELDLPFDMQKKLDLVLAGFHTLITPASFAEGFSFATRSLAARLFSGARRRARCENTKTIVEAVYSNTIDCITHPGLHIDIDTGELARACANTDTFLEINNSHETDAEFINAAAAQGADFILNSDAHDPQMVGAIKNGLASLGRSAIGPERVVNIKPRREGGKWTKIASLL
ncbi:MAG: PHP domain-containing protein [Bacillota bacterium]